jgi:squalene synthase HpnC
MSVEHYENFPVASILLPGHLRRPVQIIYRFAREADDFADEGDMPDAERLARLDGFRAELARIANREESQAPLFRDVAEIVAEHRLPLQLFHDLLDAFAQDVVKKRYADFTELLDYCRRSANPVGRLLLHLYRVATPVNLACADDICSALQLINFWQDVKKDYAMGRIYLPQDEMAQYGVTERHIAQGLANAEWRDLMRFQTDRAGEMMKRGAPLGSILGGRTGLEMRMIIAGGMRIIDKLRGVNFDMFERRPVLQVHDWVIMLLRSAPFSLK